MKHETINIDNENPEENLVYKRGYSAVIHIILLSCDILLLNISLIATSCLNYKRISIVSQDQQFFSVLLVANLVWIVLVYALNIYAVPRLSSWESIVWNIFKSIIVHVFIMWEYMVVLQNYVYYIEFFTLFYGILIIALLIWRVVFIYSLKRYMASHLNYKNVIIVGVNDECIKIYNYLLSQKSHRYNVKALFGYRFESSDNFQINTIFQSEEKLYEYLDTEHFDEIYCTYPLEERKRIQELMSYSENNLIRFRYVPDFGALLYRKVDIEFYGNIPVLSLRREPLENIGNRIKKRIFDIVFSTLVLLFLLPFVFPIIAILIKLSSKGPVFFKQKRNGNNKQLFDCYKFRTMRVNELSDIAQATQKDPRVTKIGSILRKTNLDELPQFINVWLGDMSVVGPRPHMLKHTEEYKAIIDKFMVRHFVKPGITGWAQVSGFRGITETSQKMIKRVRYDIWYIENWSLQLDIKIIFMTIYNMVKGEKNAF